MAAYFKRCVLIYLTCLCPLYIMYYRLYHTPYIHLYYSTCVMYVLYICLIYILIYSHVGYGRIPRSRESLPLYGQAQELTMVSHILYAYIILLLLYYTLLRYTAYLLYVYKSVFIILSVYMFILTINKSAVYTYKLLIIYCIYTTYILYIVRISGAGEGNVCK